MIDIVIPTLGRDTLPAAVQSLQRQFVDTKVIVKDGSRDTLIKIKEAVNQSQTELFAVADDDAIYPDHWISDLYRVMKDDKKVGFAGGPCRPLLNSQSSATERCIAEVSASYLGTTNLSFRVKQGDRIRKADETNLVANGLYRREVFAKILNEEFDKIPIAAWENYILIRMHQLGYSTMQVPSAYFLHKQRSSPIGFMRQIFRSGTGRINFFIQFKWEALKKPYIFVPLLFTLYILTLPLTLIFAPLLIYVLLVIAASWRSPYRFRLPFFYFMLHISYGLGMLWGSMTGGAKRWN